MKLSVEGLGIRYGKHEALKNVSFQVAANEILGIIGPAGAGKTSMLRALNRTLETVPGAVMTGSIKLDGLDTRSIRQVSDVRRRVGMVAPLPVGLPMSIYDNVAFASRMVGIKDKAVLDQKVETCLRQAALWDEVKDRLPDLGTRLSGGQQQRLTIARALSHDPEVLCLDEFSIAIDPVTTMRIEDVLQVLKEKMAIILVTNLTQQARRLARRTGFILDGELVELDDSDVIFDQAKDPRTRAYVAGEFG